MVAKVEGKDYDLAAFSTGMLTDPSDGIEQFVNGEVKGYNNPKVKELYEKACLRRIWKNARKYIKNYMCC